MTVLDNRSNEYYLELFRTVYPLYNSDTETIKRYGNLIAENTKYEGFSIPSFVVGIIHAMEGNCDFEKSLKDGSQIKDYRWTTEAKNSIDNLAQYLQEPLDTIPKVLRFIESWNGFGYANKGLHSPYLWARSNHGVGVGKFVQDGIYNPNAESKQIGAALILRHMLLQNPSLFTTIEEIRIVFDLHGEHISQKVIDLQKFLNKHGKLKELLKIDGWAGNKTADAFYKVFGAHLDQYTPF